MNHKRKINRLKGYAYSQMGGYFVTICTKDRINYFDKYPEIKNIVVENWDSLTNQYKNIKLGEFVIMGNHVHGIIFIKHIETECRGLIHQTPKKGAMNRAPTRRIVLGKIIRYFKARCSKLIRDSGYHDFQWQRNYHDHVLRNEKDLDRVCQYIRFNPVVGKDE